MGFASVQRPEAMSTAVITVSNQQMPAKTMLSVDMLNIGLDGHGASLRSVPAERHTQSPQLMFVQGACHLP
jgi:hypothetical protein